MITLSTDTKRLWAWLTRTGMGRRFPGMPIGWYQCHQVACEDVLAALLQRLEVPADSSPLRVQYSNVQAQAPHTRTGRPTWYHLATVGEVFKLADDIARGNGSADRDRILSTIRGNHGTSNQNQPGQ